MEAAVSALRACRSETAEDAKEWEEQIGQWEDLLSGDDEDDGFADWIAEILAYNSAPAVNTARVNRVDASGTRMNRLSANDSVLSNGDNVTVHVMTENEICLRLYADDGKNGKRYVQFARVRVTDTRDPEAEPMSYSTNKDGAVYIPTNELTLDSDKTVHFKLEVNAEKRGYRSFGIEEVAMKAGSVRMQPLVALDDDPYVYSAAFNGHDIINEEYEMIYSSLNDWDFEIRVEVRKPGSGSAPTPKLGYWAKGDSNWKWELQWAEPTGRDGNTYIFKDKWKRMFAPELSEKQRPFIAFSKDEGAQRFRTHLISLKSVVDSPVEEGSGAFKGIMGQGLGFDFKIPVIDANVSLNLPFKEYLPRISIDMAGIVTMSMGSELLQNKLKNSKLNWQSQDMADLKARMQAVNRECGFAQYKAQMGVAYDYYKEKRWKFLGASKLGFGMFGLVSARWEIDNSDGNITRKFIKGRGAMGALLKYTYSWTISYPLGPVPLYLTLTLGISAGFAIGLQVGFSWDGKRIREWEFKPLRDITVLISGSFSAQIGVGIKGFFELWGRFTASLNMRLTLLIMGDGISSFVIKGGVSLSAGVTLCWLEFSKGWGPWGGQLWPKKEKAANPLQQYAANAADAPQEVVPATQEPAAYPQLAPAAKAILTNEVSAHSTIKVGFAGGHTYAFYLGKAVARLDSGEEKTCDRVSYVDVNTGKKGSLQDALTLAAVPSIVNGRIRHADSFNDYASDVWSDGKVIVVVACSARAFDDDGYPQENRIGNGNTCAYILLLGVDESGELTLVEPGNAQDIWTNLIQSMLMRQGLTAPHIEYARMDYDEGGNPDTFEVYGYAEKIDDGDGEKRYTCFECTSKHPLFFLSDAAIKNALGEDHERVNLRSGVRGHGASVDESARACLSFSFLALSRPREGVQGESAIEMYDWDMNVAPVTTRQIPGTYEWEVVDSKRQAVALRKGDIGGFEMVQTVGSDGKSYAQTLFYTEGETDADGAKHYKLKGLHIGGKQGAGTRDLTYELTDYAYDIAMPTSDFRVATVRGTPYIYWLSTAQKKKDSDPDTWRVWVTIYDPATNTMSTPSVFSEFTLKDGIVPRDVLLTTDGQGYFTATPIPEDGSRKTQPMTLYSFPMTLRPVLTIKDMVVEELTVAAGDFEDASIALMNEGNMGVSAFDLELYVQEGDQIEVVETLHADCLRPENSTLTMMGATQSVTLPKGRQAIYRNSDFDYTTRQRDWVLSEQKQTLHLTEKKGEAWRSSMTERDAKTNFVQTDMLMPGALAAFTGTLKIPENWSGDRTLYMRVAGISSYANWQGALANAAGVAPVAGTAANAAATHELTWALDESGDRLVLQTEGLMSNAAFANAVSSGLIASAVDAPEGVALNTAIHDLEVEHRQYSACDGTELLDICLVNFADTKDRFKLTCSVYVDGVDKPYHIDLPFYAQAVAGRAAHTFTMPLDSLVPDPEAHQRARVVVCAVNRDESVYANNEFTVYLGGGVPLHFEEQPEDETVQEGEDVSFEVAVGGGVPPYSYQWQVWDEKHRKWVDLPGFTDPALSREAVEKKWDGCKFRCVVTDAEGTQIISQTVTLTVRDRVPTGDDTSLPLYLAVAAVALALLWWTRRRASV